MESIQTNQRHNHINSQFKHGNVDLGFRMLVDIVLDTNDASAYQYIIDLMHWQDANPNNEEAFSQKCIEILDKIGEFAIKDLSPDQTLLVAKGLTKTYKGRRFSFGPIDMTIKAGDMIGLVGENGNGKTTLLRLLARDLQLTSGSIDYPYITDKSSIYDIRTQLIYIPQRTPTWYGAVKDNLKFAAAHYGVAPQDNEATVLMMMIRFGLWKYRHYHWNELSSGYKMRFELARTFLRKPKLLLIDEPLSNLDIVSQKLIVEDLMMLSKSPTNPLGIVLSSQQLYELEKISTDVIFLKNGVPTQSGNTKIEEGSVVVELEIQQDQATLEASLKGMNLKGITFNGGTYLIHVNDCHVSQLLQAFADAKLDVTYFRNVTNSTRRFF